MQLVLLPGEVSVAIVRGSCISAAAVACASQDVTCMQICLPCWLWCCSVTCLQAGLQGGRMGSGGKGCFLHSPRNGGYWQCQTLVHTMLARFCLYHVSRGRFLARELAAVVLWLSWQPVSKPWRGWRGCSKVGEVSAGFSLFLFWCVRLKEKPLRLGSVFVFPVFPSFFLLFFCVLSFHYLEVQSEAEPANFLMSPPFLQQTFSWQL